MTRCGICDCELWRPESLAAGACLEDRTLIRSGAIDAVMWVPVVGFERRFEVSSEGDVRDARSKRLIPVDYSGRYARVTLGGRRRYLHDVVMESFCGPKPVNALVLHRDDDGHNPRLPNLSFGDHAENHADYRRNRKDAA